MSSSPNRPTVRYPKRKVRLGEQRKEVKLVEGKQLPVRNWQAMPPLAKHIAWNARCLGPLYQMITSFPEVTRVDVDPPAITIDSAGSQTLAVTMRVYTRKVIYTLSFTVIPCDNLLPDVAIPDELPLPKFLVALRRACLEYECDVSPASKFDIRTVGVGGRNREAGSLFFDLITGAERRPRVR